MPIYASGPYTALFFSIVAGDLKIVVPRKHAVGGFGKRPGRYLCNGGGIIAWDNGGHDMTGASDLRWYADHEATDEIRRQDNQWNAAFDVDQWVAPLPELPFWEHDLVRDKTGRVIFGGDGLLRIACIKYNHWGEKRTDGSEMSLYDVEAPYGRSGRTWTANENLELVERGNVWKWFNARETIVWKDLKQEADFHKWLGACDEIRNPKTGFYTWNLRDIFPALELGTIDAPSVSNGFFGVGSVTHCYKFHDRDLGERVRAAAIIGFYDKEKE
jgi:hypothetical protein